MEIERKYLVNPKMLPFLPEHFSHRHIEQGYLCTEPVVRIRQDDDAYILTYKSKGLMVREEYNLPLTKEAYLHLKGKVDGRMIIKNRYIVPFSEIAELPNLDFCIELDFFLDELAGLVLAEVEFPDEESANAFKAPVWFGEDVTYSSKYHNSTLSQK